MSHIKTHGLLESFLDLKSKEKTTVFLIKSHENKYEFFCLDSNRERKLQQTFDQLEAGVRRKIEHYLFEFFHRATDAEYPISFEVSDLVDDIILNHYRFKTNASKYRGRLTDDFKTSDIMNYIRKHNLFDRFLESDDQVADPRND